ncbi:YggS family pyridoxal phosphate-dependent enzyme [Microcella sp.]|uniref:YggS family pyridoxal phosphate-dependent enzyme n=1 Tax=Microcella sp. TaxID=1913979 RepID=UPI00391DBEEC
MDTTGELAERVERVLGRVADACRDAGRRPDDVTVIAVTKFHPASLIRDLVRLGIHHVGENRHQDAAPKAAELRDEPLTWHFVGQLQSNKARAVLGYARIIHSVDRPSLVTALAKADEPCEVFLEVNLTDDPGRGGVVPDELETLAERVLEHPQLRLAGVMGVAPLDEIPRAAFARLRLLSERVRRLDPGARAISAGMSGDFPDAIAEGATHLRIGTAITGKRPAAP